MAKMRLLLDEDVDVRRVGEFFRSRGHEVILVTSSLGSMSPDRLIAFTAGVEGLVVVSHDRHFRNFNDMLPEGVRKQYRSGTGRIWLRVRESRAVPRLEEVIDLIELFYERSLQNRRRFYIEVTEVSIDYKDRDADLPDETQSTNE